MSDAPILFIDDNLLCHLDNCERLREFGYVVEEAYTAPEAMLVIDRHSPIKALVTDIDLGEQTDGFELARRARAAYPRLPVVYISGSSVARHVLEGVEDSVFISKPFEPAQILDALRRIACRQAA